MTGERWIFLDLDGTVLDVSARYHRVHQDIVERHGGWPFPHSVYWEAKRNLVPETEILIRCGLSPETAREADAQRRQEIEGSEVLQLDEPWPYMADVLDELEDLGRLAIVTLREHRDRLDRQVTSLMLPLYFKHVIAGPGDGTRQAKAALLRRSGISWGPGSVLAGDTEVDVASGRALGLRTVAVGCGLRTPELLAPWSPDALLDDLRQLARWLDPSG
ncbi:MAG TPA: HAD family hydrolase [Thermoanaerobaculia bacterium]|jgi:phosphoglycolate phosphatase-like HAD superfamily hydrolase